MENKRKNRFAIVKSESIKVNQSSILDGLFCAYFFWGGAGMARGIFTPSSQKLSGPATSRGRALCSNYNTSMIKSYSAFKKHPSPSLTYS